MNVSPSDVTIDVPTVTAPRPPRPQRQASSSATPPQTAPQLTIPKMTVTGGTPDFTLLDQHVRPEKAEAAAFMKGKKKAPQLVSRPTGKGAYRYPLNSIADVLLDPETDEDKFRLKHILRLERYAAAFPDRNVNPVDAFDLTIPQLRAFLDQTEKRLIPKNGPAISPIAIGLSVIGAQIGKRVSCLRGLDETYGRWSQENAELLTLIEAKYSGFSFSIEVSALISLGLATFYHYQIVKELDELDEEDGGSVGSASGSQPRNIEN